MPNFEGARIVFVLSKSPLDVDFDIDKVEAGVAAVCARLQKNGFIPISASFYFRDLYDTVAANEFTVMLAQLVYLCDAVLLHEVRDNSWLYNFISQVARRSKLPVSVDYNALIAALGESRK